MKQISNLFITIVFVASPAVLDQDNRNTRSLGYQKKEKYKHEIYKIRFFV